METVLVNVGDALAPRFREPEAAVAELTFEHAGDGAGDGGGGGSGGGPAARDLAGEHRARYVLESLGSTETSTPCCRR